MLVCSCSVLSLTSCGASVGSATQDASRDGQSGVTTTTAVPTAVAEAATIDASDSGGDAIQTIVYFGDAESLSQSNISSSLLDGCGVDPSRALIVAGELQTTDKSSLSVETDETIQYSAIDPGTMYFVLGLSAGAQCEAPDDNPNVSFTVSPGTPNNFDFWIVLPDAITPDYPRGNSTELGQWVVEAPQVSLEGNAADTTTVFGPRVVACGQGISGEPDVYLVPAGALPQVVGGDLYGQQCTPQPTASDS